MSMYMFESGDAEDFVPGRKKKVANTFCNNDDDALNS